MKFFQFAAFKGEKGFADKNSVSKNVLEKNMIAKMKM